VTVVTQIGNALVPATALADTSSPRVFNAIIDASDYPGVVLAAGDVWNNCGISYVAPTPPTASFTATPTFLVVAFDASGSDATDPATITTYGWAFGDSRTGTGVTTSHTFPADGTYTVTLTVTDSNGLTTSATKTITVAAAAPPPPPTGTVLYGDTPYTNGTSSSDIAAQDTRYGVASKVERLFWSGTAGTNPLPVSSGRKVVGSFKTLGSNTAPWARTMWRWCFIHEIDSKDKHPSKFPPGTSSVAQWKTQMAGLVAMGIPGLSVIVTADCFVNSSKNPADYLVPGVKIWGIDLDGISSTTGYHDYTREITNAAKFFKANGITNWYVGELSADRATSTDPDGTARAAWLTKTAHAAAAAGAEAVCLWEDAKDQPGSVFSKPAEISAVAALFRESY
jgi:hypothetical protein